jgi:hypothetical protein
MFKPVVHKLFRKLHNKPLNVAIRFMTRLKVWILVCRGA